MGGATWVLASYADSSAYSLAAFAGLAQGVWNTTSDSWIDRAGDLRESSQKGAGDPTKKSGIWGRFIGSGAERSTETQTTMFQNQSVTVDTGYDQTLWGFQAGIDHEFEGTVADGVVVAGVLGGYVSSNVDFNSGDSVKMSGPQVGVYASWVKGGAYVDALVKGDFLTADYNVGGSDSDTDSTTIGVRVETGYRFYTATGMFIEPNASLAYAHTSIDDITVAGTPARFDDGDGLEGKLGARFGSAMLKDGVKYDPYLSVGIAGNLLNDNSVFFSSGPGLVIEDVTPDVFGEVGAGINIFSTKSGWTGFAKADLRFGDDYIGGTGKIGANWAW
jgi:outer membrane autotransporter protein